MGDRGLATTGNFTFLRCHDAKLFELAALAERCFRDDPATAKCMGGRHHIAT